MEHTNSRRPHLKCLPNEFEPLSLLLHSLAARASDPYQTREHEYQEHSVDLEEGRDGGKEGGRGREGGEAVRPLIW